MAEIITDLDQIKRLAQQHEDEDWRFRSYIKGYLDWSDTRLDGLVNEIAQEVTEAIDCKACGNCCRLMVIGVTNADIPRLARALGLTKEDFEARYVTANDPGEKFITESPCPFMDGCLCSVYEDRPKDCREYPHLHKTGFRSRTFGVIGGLEICPIVYNTWELLKEELPFRRRRR